MEYRGKDTGEGVVEDMAEDAGARGLIRTAYRSRACDDNGNIEDHPERGHTEDNGCNDDVDPPKIAGEGAGEEQERSLQHQRQRLHYIVEVPGYDTIKLALPVLAAFYGRPSHLGGGISVQPLLAEHREEGGKK
jgi:hypothetical protein